MHKCVKHVYNTTLETAFGDDSHIQSLLLVKIFGTTSASLNAFLGFIYEVCY